MMLVPSNAVRLFARTSILVVATGLFHGIFLLPIIVRSFTFNMNVANEEKTINKTQIFPIDSDSDTMKRQLKMRWDDSDTKTFNNSNETTWKTNENTKCS